MGTKISSEVERFLNKISSTLERNMGILVKYNCINCDTYVERLNSSGKYCSIECQGSYQSKQKLEAWLNNNDKVGKTIVKRYLAEQYGNKCSVCNITEWNATSLVFDLDHIDGDAYNNHPNNLRLLCPNCHAQTPTYKNRNKGNGRASNAGKGWLLQ
jgi:hypothetical protein